MKPNFWKKEPEGHFVKHESRRAVYPEKGAATSRIYLFDLCRHVDAEEIVAIIVLELPLDDQFDLEKLERNIVTDTRHVSVNVCKIKDKKTPCLRSVCRMKETL